MKVFIEKYKDYLIGILVFLISLGVYIHTLAPTITYEDSGELITSPYILGIAHPPGYPFYTVVMKVMMTLLPISNIAFRGNLATAIWGSLAVLMVFFIVLKLERNLTKEGKSDSSILLDGYVPAIIASLLTSFSSMIWLHSVTTEVYSLNLFLMMLLTYLLVVWEETRKISYIYCGALIYGLSFGNHQEAVLFSPGFLYFFLTTSWREILRIKNIIFVVLMFGLGILIYLYLPIRSAQNPYLDWSNPEGWRGFLFSIKREQYGAIDTARDIKQWFQQLNLFGFIEQVSIWTFFFAFLGIWRLFKKNLKLFITFSLFTFCSGVGFIYLTNSPVPTHIFALLRTFYLPLYALVAIWISLGVAFLLDKIHFYCERIRPISKTSWSFILLPFILLPVTSLWDHYKDYDFSQSYFAYDYAVNMAQTAEYKSVIFTYLSGDTFPLWYYKYSEGRRPDLAVVHQRMIAMPWYYAQVVQDEPQMIFTRREFLEWENTEDFMLRSVIITKDVMTHNPQYKFYYTLFTRDYLPKNNPMRPRGILWQEVSASSGELDEKIWLNYSYRGLGDRQALRNIRANEILRQLYEFNLNLAREYIKEDRPELTIYQYQLANKIHPTAEAYCNIGYSYYKMNNVSSTVRNFKEFLGMDPTGPQSENIRNWILSMEKVNPTKL